MTPFPFLIPANAILAHFSGDNDFKEKDAPATLLNSVFTGPGHRTHTLTGFFCFLSS